MENIDYYKQIHNSNAKYGAGSRHFYFVFSLLVYLKSRTVIDFGCGKGVLADQIQQIPHLVCKKYDPAIAGIDEIPEEHFDCLVNTDVLEHIPETELDQTIRHFPRLSDTAIVIPHLRKAAQRLPNGENAHCTLKTPNEWAEVLSSHYSHVTLLPHESDRHAMLLCSQGSIDLEPMTSALQYVADMVNDRVQVAVRLDDPFPVRVRRAIKTILGIRTLR